MVFAILFLLWTLMLGAAWRASRTVALTGFAVLFVVTVAVFIHHITDPLTLSF